MFQMSNPADGFTIITTFPGVLLVRRGTAQGTEFPVCRKCFYNGIVSPVLRQEGDEESNLYYCTAEAHLCYKVEEEPIHEGSTETTPPIVVPFDPTYTATNHQSKRKPGRPKKVEGG